MRSAKRNRSDRLRRLAKADEIDAVAIAIESGGQGAVESALLGGVSADVPHHAHRPVLFVPPSGEAVGARGRGALASAVLGSALSVLVHHAEVPIPVVPSHA